MDGSKSTADRSGCSPAARRGLILVCVLLVLVPVSFALLRLAGLGTPGTSKSLLRRRLHGGDGSSSEQEEGGGGVLLSPTGPQIAPRFTPEQAAAANTRAALSTDDQLINAVIVVSASIVPPMESVSHADWAPGGRTAG